MSGQHRPEAAEFVRAIGDVARELLGEPTEHNRGKHELRFGARGSLSISLTKGTWHDHEIGEGGGLITFVMRERSVDKAGAMAWLRERGHIPKEVLAKSVSRRQVAAYDYEDEAGKLLFQVVRFEPKDFRQRAPNGNGWVWKMAGIRRVLYGLPAVIAAVAAGQTIYLVEGEKAANAAVELGVVATCSPGGANKWRPEYGEPMNGADVVILPDNDEPGRKHAASVAEALQGIARRVRILALPDLSEKEDVADWIAAGGTAVELARLTAAIGSNGIGKDHGESFTSPKEPTPGGDDEDLDGVIKRLARLRPIEYGRERENAAKTLGCRVSDIDLEVKRERGDVDLETDTRGQGRPLDLQPPEPCPEAVDGPTMLTELEDYFRRHLRLPDDGAALLALWAVHTHCFTAWRYTPRLNVSAATKNSGKSRVLALMRMVAAKPLRCENITPAAVFRTIDAAHPTLLIDEADQFLTEMPDLIGVLNGGHERGGQTIRTVLIGDALEPRLFDTFAPIAIAGIGRLPGTLASRCIRVEMQRARRGDMPPDIDAATEAQGDRLTRQIARWVSDNLPALEAARPDTAGLINRLRDNWQPLFAIADVIGGGWPELARKAAKSLDVADDDADSLGEQLLADIRDAFQALFEEQIKEEKELTRELSSEALVVRLVALEGRPWAEMGRDRRPLTKNRMARMLRPFKVHPEPVGEDHALRGYKVTSFGEVFERHLPSQTGSIP